MTGSEPWIRPERTPEADALLPVAVDLRGLLARRAHVTDLVSAEGALASLREERAPE